MQKPRIFISYSSGDRPAATGLEKALTQTGYTVWRDQSRIDTDWSVEVAQAVASHNVVCLLWSHNAKASHWIQHEWLTARALEIRILPILLPDAPELPPPLTNSEGVQSDSEHFDAVFALLERIPTFRVKYDYTVLPPRSFLPFLPNPDFVGRKAELVELYLNLIGNLQNLGTRQAGLVGMGGTGKTQLAAEFGYRFSHAFDAGVFWIQAAKSADWLPSLIELARDRLQLTIAEPLGPQSAKQYLFALQAYCKLHPQMLIIFDNVVDPNLLTTDQQLLGAGISPLTLGCGFLFTTRSGFEIPGVAQQIIGVLAPEPAYDLIAVKRVPQNSTEQEHIRKICEALGNLPLAIVLAGGYLHSYPSVSLTDYRSELVSRTLDTIDFDPIPQSEMATRHATAVAATLRSQWESLADDVAKRILRIAAELQESAITPVARLALLCGPLPSQSAIDRPFERACRLLWSASLMDCLDNGQSARVHPLIRQFVLGLFSPRDAEALRSESSTKLGEAYIDPARLAKEFHARGIEEILADIRVAGSWATPEIPLRPLGIPLVIFLRRLERLLERERNHLASEFRVQVQHRAVSMGEAQIGACLAQAPEQSSAPWIETEAFSEPEDLAWILTLKGHESAVTSLTAHPGRLRCVSGSDDQKVVVWDINRPQIVRTLKGPKAQVTCLSRIWDQRYILAGYSDSSLTVWDIEMGNAVRSWAHDTPYNWADFPEALEYAPPQEVKSVCVGPDTRVAVSGVHSFRDHLAVWDLATGKKRASLEGHLNGVIALAINASGNVLASGSWDHSIILWNLQTLEQIHALQSHTDGVGAVAFSPDGRLLASGSHDNNVMVWDVHSGVPLKTLLGHTGSVNAVAFLDNGHVISGSSDRTLRIWDVATGQETSVFRGHSGGVLSLAKPPAASQILSGSDDCTIRLWDLEAKTISGGSPSVSSSVFALSLHPNGQSMLCSTKDEFSFWSTPGFSKTETFPVSLGDYSTQNLSYATQRALLISRTRNQILIWDVRQSKGLWQMPVAQRGRPAMSENGQRVVAVWQSPDREDNTAIALDVDSGKTKLLNAHRFPIMSTTVSGDGRLALTVSFGSDAIIWDLETGQQIRSFTAPFVTLNATMDSHGQLALLSGFDGKVALFDVERVTLRATLDGGFRFVRKFAISQDSNFAVVCGDDDSLTIWNTADGAKLARLFLSSSVTALAMSQNSILLGEVTGRLCFLRLVIPHA